VLEQEFHYVKEIVFRIAFGIVVDWPKILLSYIKQHFQFNVFDLSWDVISIYTVETECLVEISFLTELIEDPYEQIYDVGKWQAIAVRIYLRSLRKVFVCHDSFRAT